MDKQLLKQDIAYRRHKENVESLKSGVAYIAFLLLIVGFLYV